MAIRTGSEILNLCFDEGNGILKTSGGGGATGDAGGTIDSASIFPDIKLKTPNGDIFSVVQNADNNESTVLGDITRPLHLDASEDVILGKIDRTIDNSFIIQGDNSESLNITTINVDFIPPNQGFVTGLELELANVQSNTQMKFIMKDKTDSNRIIYQVNVIPSAFSAGTDTNAYTVTNGVNVLDLKSIFALSYPDEHTLEITFNKQVTIKGKTISTIFTPKLKIIANEISVETVASKEWALDNGLQGIKDGFFPIGFNNGLSTVEMTFDKINRIFSISPKSPNAYYRYYINGVKKEITTTKTIQILDNIAVNYIFIDSFGNLSVSNTYTPNDYTKLPLIFIRWNAVAQEAIALWNISIGNPADPLTYSYIYNRGGIYSSGLNIGYTIGDGSLDSHCQYSMTDGSFKIVDTLYSISNSANPTQPYQVKLSPTAYNKVYYRIGTSPTLIADVTSSSVPIKMGATYPYYNKNTAGTYSLEEVPNGKWFSVFIGCSTDIQNNNIFSLMGQRYDNSLSEAKENQSFSSIDAGDFNLRSTRLLYQIFFQVNSTFTNAYKAKIDEVKDVRTYETIPVTLSFLSEHNSLVNRNALHAHESGSIDMSTLRPLSDTANSMIFQNSTGAKNILTFDTENNKVIIENCFIPPKLTTAQRNAISNLTGMETVFDTDLGVLLSYDLAGGKWFQI